MPQKGKREEQIYKLQMANIVLTVLNIGLYILILLTR